MDLSKHHRFETRSTDIYRRMQTEVSRFQTENLGVQHTLAVVGAGVPTAQTNVHLDNRASIFLKGAPLGAKPATVTVQEHKQIFVETECKQLFVILV